MPFARTHRGLYSVNYVHITYAIELVFSGSIFEVKKRRRVQPLLTLDLLVMLLELAFVSKLLARIMLLHAS